MHYNNIVTSTLAKWRAVLQFSVTFHYFALKVSV